VSEAPHRRIVTALLARQNPGTHGWGYTESQDALEPTCLALLAARQWRSADWKDALQHLQHMQRSDGSWCAFVGDDESACWTTALAVIALLHADGVRARVESAIQWLLNSRGQESHWSWRFKFRTVDTAVRFNPEKFGWGWVNGTLSWVIPTALAMIALQQAQSRGWGESSGIQERVRLGAEMLLDRACLGGGWNAGNSVVYGVPLGPHLDATAIALLALRRYHAEPMVRESMWLLQERVNRCPSPYSVAWAILALAAYREAWPELDCTVAAGAERLVNLIGTEPLCRGSCVLAVSALALDAVSGDQAYCPAGFPERSMLRSE
jgi:hypothetical protein